MTPIDRMDPEAYPLPKRFNFTTINVRRFYHSFYAAGASVNYSTHALYNSSTGDRVIVLRGVAWTGFSAASPQYLFAQQGIIGTDVGREEPAWLGERAGAGQHCWTDAATASTPAMFVNILANVGAQFIAGPPVYVLPPGWSVGLQQNTKVLTVSVSWWWEELDINDPMLGSIIG